MPNSFEWSWKIFSSWSIHRLNRSFIQFAKCKLCNKLSWQNGFWFFHRAYLFIIILFSAKTPLTTHFRIIERLTLVENCFSALHQQIKNGHPQFFNNNKKHTMCAFEFKIRMSGQLHTESSRWFGRICSIYYFDYIGSNFRLNWQSGQFHRYLPLVHYYYWAWRKNQKWPKTWIHRI